MPSCFARLQTAFKVRSRANEPAVQGRAVYLVHVAPDDQGTLALGSRAIDGKYSVAPASEFDAQAK